MKLGRKIPKSGLKGFMLHTNGKSLENLNIQNKRAAAALGSKVLFHNIRYTQLNFQDQTVILQCPRPNAAIK